jgi:anti-anti-sigma factor
LEINIQEEYGYKIINVSGHINLLKDSISLKSLLNSLIEEKAHNIAISLKEVEYIDSSALNVFLYAKTQAEKVSGHFCLIEPNQYVQDVISVVGLNDIFTIIEDKDQLKKIN